jgi:O-antigen ligase
MVVAAIASLTRNAMLGMMAGVTVVLALRKPVALLLLPIVAAAVLILSPEVVRNRIMSITDLNDSSIRERLYVWRAGVEIIRDNPLFGVGQNSFPLVYPKYRRPDVKEPNISNLHNNFLELGAERGLVGLTVWIWLWVATAWAMFKGWRGAPVAGRMAKAAGLGSLTAFMTAGLFEFNFGTAMVQMMMFYITGVALAASRAD